jgi:hypothetical protein
LTFNQDDESEGVKLAWKSETLLEVRLPRSANNLEGKIESYGTVRVVYVAS